MINEIDKLKKAKYIINTLIQGKDPISGNVIEDGSFIRDQRMISCFAYIADVLSKEIEYNEKKHLPDKENFDANKLDLSKIKMPEEDCGINAIASCINELVDGRIMKKVTGAQINAKLKAMGILSEAVDSDGKTVTTTNEKSIEYGIYKVVSSYNGREYEKVVFNEKGRKFIIEHLNEIMNFSES